MAARGYFETYNFVKADLVRGANAGTVFRNALARWYQALFGPSVRAGILEASDLAGYRNDQVFIRGALHVPLSKEAVRDCMPVLFELLEAEAEPQVRAVLDGSHKLRPTEAGSETGSKFPDCCRIRSAPFDYRVKAPDEHRPPRQGE